MAKVLVIDDDKTARRLISKALEKFGLKSIECENGREGWQLLWDNSDVTCVITDMVMPDMDGRELVHLIRNQEEMLSLPVIMVSGVLSVEEIEPILHISPSNTFFIAKPVNIELLQKHLSAIGMFGGHNAPSENMTH